MKIMYQDDFDNDEEDDEYGTSLKGAQSVMRQTARISKMSQTTMKRSPNTSSVLQLPNAKQNLCARTKEMNEIVHTQYNQFRMKEFAVETNNSEGK